MMVIEFSRAPTLLAAYIENKDTLEIVLTEAAEAAAKSIGKKFQLVYYRSARDVVSCKQLAA